MKRYIPTIVTAILFFGPFCHAQKWSVGTDVVTWLNLGTINIEGSMAVAKEVTINAGMEVNPWTYRHKGKQFQDRRQSYRIGARWWPWHIYSGWWFGAGVQYQEYNRGGILSPATEEGDAFGMAVSSGYTLMLNKNFNIEFGMGMWGGKTYYTSYACPKCGKITDDGEKWFLLPNDVSVSLMFIF